MSEAQRDPDLSPEPVELLGLPHSKLYLRRRKDHDDDYEDIDEVSPLPSPPFKPASRPRVFFRENKDEFSWRGENKNVPR